MSDSARDTWWRRRGRRLRRRLGPVAARSGRLLAGLAEGVLAALQRLSDRWVARLTGHDRAFARGLTYSAALHVACVVGLLLPSLVPRFGCSDAYDLPAGNPRKKAQRRRRVIRIRRIRTISNPRTDIAFNPPKIEQIQLGLDERTLEARAEGGEGPVGLGGSGRGRVRFIRLKYRGGDWDQDMDLHSGTNLLRQMRTHGFPTADEEEAKTIRQLARFKKKRAPPFVYITGSRDIRLSAAEARILREYLLERGGMIFADNGGGRFNGSFRRMMAKVLEGVPYYWIDIPNDHPVYRAKFLLNGAPPLWAHSGSRAAGIVHGGRLIVFYHQGDIGDAWKDMHSGARADVVEAAYRCGINVIVFAADQYRAFLSGKESSP